MLFDTHAHLDDRRFDADRAALLARLPEQGIGLLMNPGCDLPSSRAACALARAHSWIYAAVGSHPDAADQIGDSVLQEYRSLVRENPLAQSKAATYRELILTNHDPRPYMEDQLDLFAPSDGQKWKPILLHAPNHTDQR